MLKISDFRRTNTEDSMKTLNVSDRPLTAEVLQRLNADVLPGSGYAGVEMSNCELTDDAIPELIGLFNKLPDLRQIVLSHNKLSSQGIRKLFMELTVPVTHIDISHNGLTDLVAGPLLNYVSSEKHHLIHLDLSHNAISDSFIKALIMNIEKVHIQQLCLSYNNVNTRMAKLLSESLEKSENIEWVDLRMNYINIDELDPQLLKPGIEQSIDYVPVPNSQPRSSLKGSERAQSMQELIRATLSKLNHSQYRQQEESFSSGADSETVDSMDYGKIDLHARMNLKMKSIMLESTLPPRSNAGTERNKQTLSKVAQMLKNNRSTSLYSVPTTRRSADELIASLKTKIGRRE